jgi:hypothetical protein
MKLTKKQIKFLDRVCKEDNGWTLNSNGEVDVRKSVYMDKMKLTEIPVKFGIVTGFFSCSNNRLTSLKNCPDFVGGDFYFDNNQLTDYFKSIKEEDFPHWCRLVWGEVLPEYPFLVNIGVKYFDRDELKEYLILSPQTKLYLE